MDILKKTSKCGTSKDSAGPRFGKILKKANFKKSKTISVLKNLK